MAGASEKTVAPRMKPDPATTILTSTSINGGEGRGNQQQSTIKLAIAAESWRFIACITFWIMVILAVIGTRVIVIQRLAAGPDNKEGDSTCGPYNQEVLPGPGLGFDFETQNLLIQKFGYSNICSYWDYSPAREIVAMFYPLFEHSLLIYLVLEFLTVALASGT